MPGAGGPSQWTPDLKINKLRADLTRRRIPHVDVTADRLLAVIDLIGDLSLTGDAIAMYPRPAWLEAMIGLFPAEAVIDLELAEMRHVDDRASTDEWGHMGG